MFFYNNSILFKSNKNTIKLVFIQNNSGGSNEMEKVKSTSTTTTLSMLYFGCFC